MTLWSEFFHIPFKNPVLVFSLLLLIILFAPLFLKRLGIPQLIGLIVAGALIGPHGFHVIEKDSSIVLFGTVGLLYIMFLAGLEIDLREFRRNSFPSVVFGLYTFAVPMTLGFVVFYYILKYGLLSSVLTASMFASHTLIAYPIVSTYGVARHRAVAVTAGGTLITDTLALLVLSVVASLATGRNENSFWLRLIFGLVFYTFFVSLIFPRLGIRFLKSYDDASAQYLFVLALVFLSAAMAQFVGIEAMVGSFVAGLVLNPLIPATSVLRNRIEFVGHTLFIPFFLIMVGMLIDFSAFLRTPKTMIVAITMTLIATTAKYLAALFTQISFRFKGEERTLIFGLSNGQAAATLAAVLVGYNIIIGETPDGKTIRLLDEHILNGTILMILVTCTVASFATQKAARKLAEEIRPTDSPNQGSIFLVPLKNEENVSELIHLAFALSGKKSRNQYLALHVVESTMPQPQQEVVGQRILNRAASVASGADKVLTPILRYDLNLAAGIAAAVRENKVSDLILGLHRRKGFADSFLGRLAETLLSRCAVATWIYYPHQPAATIRHYHVLLPQKAEYETGFSAIAEKLRFLAENTSSELTIHAQEKTAIFLKNLWRKSRFAVDVSPPLDLDQLGRLAPLLRVNEGLIIVMSRPERVSYEDSMKKVPRLLEFYFRERNFILVYPEQALLEEKDYGLHQAGIWDYLLQLLKIR